MPNWLKQSTAVEIAMGPFLDETDGKTAETGLTITQADIRLKKNGGAWAQKNASQTLTHEENGWYEVSLDTTDTGTLGILIVAIHESGALPVWREFLVVPANVYDSIVGDSDKLQVDTVQVTGTSQTARDLGASVLLSSGTGAGQISLSSGTVTVGTNNDKTGYALASGAITSETVATGAIDADALAADAVNEIADGIMTRASSNWEAAAPVKSLGTAVMKAVHRTRDNAGSLEIYRSNGTTVHASQTITTDNNNLPIDELTGAS